MKLICALPLALIASSAIAADLPARIAAPAPIPVIAPVFTWSGFYIGVNAGAARSQKNTCPLQSTYVAGVLAPVPGFAPLCDGNNDAAFTGGGQLGYNWQMGSLVFGLEGDVNWLGQNGSNGFAFNNTGTPTAGTFNCLLGAGQPCNNSFVDRTDHNFLWSGNKNGNVLSTIRGRIGFAASNTLFYVTGGAAFRGSGNNDAVTDTATTTSTIVNNITGTSSTTVTATSTTYARAGDRHNVGWALGAGLEYAFTPNASAKLEYLHAQFENNNALYLPAAANGFAFVRNEKNAVDLIRIGLNYRFGGSSASPVVARY